MSRLSAQQAPKSTWRVCVFACSKGAEVYSILWSLRSFRQDLKVDAHAVDISKEVLEFAQRGIYSTRDLASRSARQQLRDDQVAEATWQDQGLSIFHRMTKEERESMFEVNGDHASVRPWLREGITWLAGDAADPTFVSALGPQDMVVANRFLCHMDACQAERVLRNISQAVRPGGYLFVSGVDLDVRAKVASELGWSPVMDLIQEIHEGDVTLNQAWPLDWWGLEPFSHDLPDWKVRFASAFRIG